MPGRTTMASNTCLEDTVDATSKYDASTMNEVPIHSMCHSHNMKEWSCCTQTWTGDRRVLTSWVRIRGKAGST